MFLNRTYETSTGRVTSLADLVMSAFGLFASSILATCVIGGNLLILICLAVDRRLRKNRTNYFIGSLAVADLVLGVLVMPAAAAAQWKGYWPFGGQSCRIWLVLDVWLYTASIYNLIALAIDRYLAITRPLQHRSMSPGAQTMITLFSAWSFSFIVALPSAFFQIPTSSPLRCTLLLHNSAYVIYASAASFYLPTILLLYLYLAMYRTVRRVKMNGVHGMLKVDCYQRLSGGGQSNSSSNRSNQGRNQPANHNHKSTIELIGRQVSVTRGLRIHRGRYEQPVKGKAGTNAKNIKINRGLVPFSNGEKAKETVGQFLARKQAVVRKCRKKLILEFRAMRTVAMITGCFFVCWTGFCMVCTANAIAQQFGTDTNRSELAINLPGWSVDWVTWLGYANSAIDPVIYAASSERYRRAFRRILRLEVNWCV